MPELGVQRPSQYPVAGEWSEFLTGLDSLDALSERAYNEWQRRIATCMSRRGFDYVAIVYVDERSDDFYRAMNPLNEETASRWGFHVPPTPDVLDTNKQSDSAYLEALHGPDADPSTGCAPAASAAAYGAVEPLVNDLQALGVSLAESVSGYWETDQGVRALRTWSACMAEGGYEFSTLEDGFAQFATVAEISAEERQARQHAIDCDRASRVTAERSAWERSKFEAWSSEFALQWSELELRVDEASDALNAVEAESE